MNGKNYNTRKLINEMNFMLNNKHNRKGLLEGLVYGDDDGETEGFDYGLEQDMQNVNTDDRGQMIKNKEMERSEMNGQEREMNPLDENPEITKLITGIRVQTLQGLQKLAEQPESAQYDLLKKIFLLIDKAVEDKVDPEKQ